jgi:hypothetical protein
MFLFSKFSKLVVFRRRELIGIISVVQNAKFVCCFVLIGILFFQASHVKDQTRCEKYSICVVEKIKFFLSKNIFSNKFFVKYFQASCLQEKTIVVL